MTETILITGATGTVGSETVKVLSGEDVKIRAGVHSIIKGDRFKSFSNVELVQLDFHNPESLWVALTGVDRVLLITPFTQDQATLAKALIDVAKQVGELPHIVRLSASGADAEPGIRIGRDHREVEVYLEAAGLPYTILRPGGFMQNFLMSAQSIRDQNSIYLPQGEGKVSYIDARDIAAVAGQILTHPAGHENKIYELTGPEAISATQVAQALTLATDRVITYVDVPESAAESAMLQQHLPPWMVNGLLELYSIYKAGYADQVTDTVAQLSGRSPRSINDFAQDYSSYF
jgi:uncharacterized protein YbjT (DUF2867 family)